MNLTIEELKRIARWSFHFDDTNPEDLALYDKIMRRIAEKETLDQWERTQRGCTLPVITVEQETVLAYVRDHPAVSMPEISLALNVSVVPLSRVLLALSKQKLIEPDYAESKVRWVASTCLSYRVKPYT